VLEFRAYNELMKMSVRVVRRTPVTTVNSVGNSRRSNVKRVPYRL
jgi:hypothetical protein